MTWNSKLSHTVVISMMSETGKTQDFWAYHGGCCGERVYDMPLCPKNDSVRCACAGADEIAEKSATLGYGTCSNMWHYSFKKPVN